MAKNKIKIIIHSSVFSGVLKYSGNVLFLVGRRRKSNGTTVLDSIVHVCCALNNVCTGIVPNIFFKHMRHYIL